MTAYLLASMGQFIAAETMTRRTCDAAGNADQQAVGSLGMPAKLIICQASLLYLRHFGWQCWLTTGFRWF